MSVGGKIIDVYREKEHRTFVNTWDGSSQCSIYCDDLGNDLKITDSFWWQGNICFWTPKKNNVKTCNHKYHYSCNKVGIDYDIQLPKLGFSFPPKSVF